MPYFERPDTTQETSISKILLQSVVQQNHFADDETDEIKIRLNGDQPLGIFKVWSAPVIARLEGKSPNEWAEMLRGNPHMLFQSLEFWRSEAAQADRYLQQIFSEEQLPDETDAAVDVLYARLTAAFAASSPLYHIEALVADTRHDKTDNPIEFGGEMTSAGQLDAVAILLPAALKNVVTAKPGNWQGLNWKQLEDTYRALNSSIKPRDEELRTILQQVSHLSSLDTTTVLFAANALEYIPNQVGGKTSDFNQDEAIQLLKQILEHSPPNHTTTTVAKDMNAKIRFLNWTPAIKDDDNFSGQHWAYDSVCATAETLFVLLRENAEMFFETGFCNELRNEVAPQLDNIDATSAKGRFLLKLLHDGMFTPQGTGRITSFIKHYAPKYLERLSEESKYGGFDELSEVSQVGGKALGLRIAVEIFGHELVQESMVFSVDQVNRWLMGLDELPPLLDALDGDGDNRSNTAKLIRRIIASAEPPRKLLKLFTSSINGTSSSRLVFRSSSFDEDVEVVGPAPGIYESVIDIDPRDIDAVGNAFKTVVSSFFSEKAIHFRDAKGLYHRPAMAVLGQKMVDGPGGSIFTEDGHQIVNIASSPAAINDHASAKQVQRLNIPKDSKLVIDPDSLLRHDILLQLHHLAKKAESVLGPIDMEYVYDTNADKLKILQLRSLVRPEKTTTQKLQTTARPLPVSRISELHAFETAGPVMLVVKPDDDTEKFQGELFRLIVKNRDKIAGVRLPETLPPTCHFVNILMTMGITIEYE